MATTTTAVTTSTPHYVYPKKYSEEALNMAIAAVENEGMTMYAATKKFGLNREILKHRFRRKKRGLSPYILPKSTFEDDEIELLKNWVQDLSERGFVYRKNYLARSAQFLLNLNPRKHIFKDNLPRLAWCQNFAKRHLESIQKHSLLKRTNFKAWFEMIEKLIDKEGLRPVLEEPGRLFVAEEIRFSLNGDTVSVPEISDTSLLVDQSLVSTAVVNPNTITVMLNFSATCCGLPPMIIYPFETLPGEIADSVPESWKAIGNSTGLLDTETFYRYISEVLVPYLDQNEVQRPILLFLDGEHTPLTMQLFRLCRDNQIVLIALYKEAAGMMERCNITASNMLENWHFSEHNDANQGVPRPRGRPSKKSLTVPSTVVCKLPTIAKVVDTFLLDTLQNHQIDEEFGACGLYPWKLDAIDIEHFVNHRPATANTSKANSSSTPANNRTLNSGTTPSSIVRVPQPSPIDYDKSMNYTKMCEIIGESFIEQIDSATSTMVDIGDDNMQILRKLRQYFGVYQMPLPRTRTVKSTAAQKASSTPKAAKKVRQVRKKRKNAKQATPPAAKKRKRGRKPKIIKEELTEDELEEEDEDGITPMEDVNADEEDGADPGDSSEDTVNETSRSSTRIELQPPSPDNPNKRRRKPCLKYRDTY